MIQVRSHLPGTRAWFEQVVTISLHTDARALPGDKVNGDQQGCWDDVFLQAGQSRGSRLWLLRRASLTQDTHNRAKNLVQAALAWLVADGWCQSLDVSVSRVAANALWFAIAVTVSDTEKFTLEFPYAV